ncbi:MULTISPECIES: TIR domain-containing protein [unclassified Amycolatopsis]|uniref:TIR domain-containing protein n=1 Tax=unclassified Amycolatopsis TaxID=2618356 RepID=UPI00068C2D87|nr:MULTISPECIES: TIR domain-containing protein [unclassified Amycolatopsis]
MTARDPARAYDYDVAVSFAGEDRVFVEAVVREVVDAGYKVFYDQDEQVALWGEEMVEYLPKVYEERARYAVVFVSRHYAAKPWTRFERRSVLLRALNQPEPYLLPVRLDATRLDGVRDSISYLDGNIVGTSGIASAICEKLGSEAAAGGRGGFNGYVPRNEHEATVLIGERPAAWEYLLFSYELVCGIERLHDAYLDHRMGFSHPADYVPVDQVPSTIQRELATVLSVIRNFAAVLSDDAQTAAFGVVGEAGDVPRIIHVASRYVAVYRSFLEWSYRLRGYATPSDEVHEVFAALARYADRPVERLRSFVYELRDRADPLHAQLLNGEDVTIQLTLPLEIAPEASAQFDQALEAFQRHLQN